ncbi:D-cysteine desulfhydrase [Erwinia sp. HR93]|uniref:D-cysteine desulfhydrase n=1 Tax=Erwinia sp. HR93 TaxID=3094840 RepID=UPI002ADEDCFC|nr:D-cysteine desulfhydrase [Erwinia sp. HR93]MEA1065298.1 D-cysteine desulfhydrase [Erwinia sp. HR93]
MTLARLAEYPRIELVGGPTPLQRLSRLSDYLGREIYIKRDDVMAVAPGGNKLRKLEFLAAAALNEGADTLLTAGAIQSNHVRQTAAVAARLGMHCVALLENPAGIQAANYLSNGNRLLFDLYHVESIYCEALNHPEERLAEQATRLEAQGFRPFIIPPGGSNPLGALGYVACAQEIAAQCAGWLAPAAVIVASGSAGTQAGLGVGMASVMPDTPVIGVTVSRDATAQSGRVSALQQSTAALLSLKAPAKITLWDSWYSPGYGIPSDAGNAAVKLLARLEGVLLDPVYTGKAMAGLIKGLEQARFPGHGPLLFIHTGGAPALFAYHPMS